MRLPVTLSLLALLAVNPPVSAGDGRDRDERHDDHDGDDDGGCCRPRGKGFWHRQCLGIGELSPGRSEGHGNGPGVHPAFTEDELRAILARADRRLGGRCASACEALDESHYGTPRGRAQAQLATLILNREAGFLDGCDGDHVREGCRRFDSGDHDGCRSYCDDVNGGRGVHRCDGDRDDEGGHHDGGGDDDHHGDKPRGGGKEGCDDHGKAKGKGKH